MMHGRKNIKLYIYIFFYFESDGRDGLVGRERVATAWIVLGSVPGGARFSVPVQIGLEARPPSLSRGTRYFPEKKRPGQGAEFVSGL
jgi:hypothetical protein